MSIMKEIHVWCDWKDKNGRFGCSEALAGAAAGKRPTIEQALSEARTMGWIRRNGRDYCPEHRVRRNP